MALFGGDQSLNITIKARDEATAAVNRVRLSIGDLAKGFAVGTIATDIFRRGVTALSGTISGSIREYNEQNAAIAQMNAVLVSTQHAAGMTARELVGLADAMAETTLYEDDMVLSAQNMLLTFTKITRDIFPETTQAVLDMSTALGQDLKSSAIQLGKALNNPIEGVSALQRVGVAFDNSQQELIATMVKSGRTLEAQKYILAEINREFGGSAQSAYEAASSITKFQKNIVELQGDIGSGLVPAVNNLFDAFNQVTTGMGRNVDVGKAVFRTISTIGEVAAAAAVGIHTMAASFVNLTTFVGQSAAKMSGVSTILKLAGKDTDQFFTDWRTSLHEQVEATSEFYFTLKDSNDEVLLSWGDIADSATDLARVGPEAYQATAEEAKKAADQIKRTEQAIADTRNTLEDYRKDLRGEVTGVGEAFVEQEEKIKQIQTDLREEQAQPENMRDAKRISELNAQLSREYAAYSNNRWIETALPAEVADARTRASQTDFERTLGDASTRIAERERTFKNDITYVINFNDAVAGDDGIRRLIGSVIAEIDRGATLRQVAGQ